MATIANLQIDLSARTARFSEGLQRAQQRVQQFSQRVQVDLQRVTQVGQRAALVFSGMTAALTLTTKRAADYASTMDKVSAQTGIAVEQMQELAFAASQSNADLASLESGLRAFVRRTAEAAAGNSSFLKGFERLGFTQEQVRAGLQDIDGFLMRVADRVAELGTTAEQSAVLMTIMGDAGRRLVPFMAQGARGIGELRERARELGLVMDEQAVRRLAAFGDRMTVLQERTSAASREMAVWFLPVMEAGVGLFEDIIGAIQDIDPALRAHAVRWTVVVGAVLGAVGVLGVLGTAVSQAGALLGAFGRLLSLVFSPIVIYTAIAIGAIALFRTAWENDWLGIRTAATEAWDNYIEPIWEALKEGWTWAIDIAGNAWEWLTNTTWAEKVEDIKGWLTDGWEWLVNIAGSAWDWLANTTWAEKIEDVRGWLSSAWNWTINLLGDAWAWIEEHLPWLATTVETLAGWLGDAWSWTWNRLGDAWDWLDQHAPAVTGMIRTLRDWLSSAWDWTINTVGAAWEWLRHLEWVDAIERVKKALSGAWDWTINRVGEVWEWLANWELGEVREIGTAILNLVIQPFGDLYEAIKRGLETGDWAGVWGATADVWRRGIQIAVGLTLAARTVQMVLNAIRSGLGLAATSVAAGIAHLGAPGVLGALSIVVALMEAREQGSFREFGANLVAALAAGIGIGAFTGSPYVGALAFTIVLNFEIGSWIGDKLRELGQKLEQSEWFQDLRAIFGGGPTYEGRVLMQMAEGTAPTFADRETYIMAPPERTWWDRVRIWWADTMLGRLLARNGGRPEPIDVPVRLTIEDVLGIEGLERILDAIYIAEGGAAARVPYGATQFYDAGRFGREINQQRFEALVDILELVEGTEEYYRAAAAVTVAWYWDQFKREFPEIGERTFAELAPEMQAMFIRYLGQFYAPPSAHELNVNWTRNVGRILGLPGFQSGTPWTGWGPTDEVAGVVHRREAVIPWDVLRRGPAAVLEFLGAPGFQSGYVPAAIGGMASASITEPDPGFIARLIESVVSVLESRGIIDPETARGIRELADNLLGIISGLYDRAKELWDQLGQVDLGEYIDQARRFRDELEALGDVAEQERLAILDRIERLDELVEIERLVAQATGQAFDETRFRAQELSRAITQVARQMFEAGESVEAVAATIAPWVEQLQPLHRQLEAQDAVATALERLAARLSEVDAGLAALARSLRWEMGRGFRLDTAGLIQSAIGFAVDSIFDLLSDQASAAEALRDASEALRQVAEEWREFLSSAPLHELFAELEGIERRRQAEQEWLDRIRERLPFGLGQLLGQLLPEATGVEVPQELLNERRRIEQQIKDIEKWGVWPWERSRYESLKDALREIDKQIREFKESAAGELEERIREALGIGWRELASGVRSAFDAATLGDFTEAVERELKMRVRNALITAFLESAAMQPLFDALSDAIFEAVRDGVLSAGELDAIEDIISQITDKSAAFFDVLDELGLSMEDLADTTKDLNRSLRNIPQGYRVERAIFEAAPPRIPALAAGGIVTRPTLALVGEAGPEAVVPLDGRGFGTVNITIQRMEVQDGRDFGRRLDEELRRRGLVRAGNVTAAWGGRR